MGLFLQDTWRARRNLTIDYGLRWDYGTYGREDYGSLGRVQHEHPEHLCSGHPGGYIYEATCNCRFAKNYPYAVGPRLGIAYTINSEDCPPWRFRGRLRIRSVRVTRSPVEPPLPT